jgi:hypothetical protein
VPVTAGERMRMAAVTPLWLMCTAGWGAASTVLLTWSALQGRSPDRLAGGRRER